MEVSPTQPPKTYPELEGVVQGSSVFPIEINKDGGNLIQTLSRAFEVSQKSESVCFFNGESDKVFKINPEGKITYANAEEGQVDGGKELSNVKDTFIEYLLLTSHKYTDLNS